MTQRQQLADLHPARRSRPHAGDGHERERARRRRPTPSASTTRGWVLPNLTDRYGSYPAVRHVAVVRQDHAGADRRHERAVHDRQSRRRRRRLNPHADQARTTRSPPTPSARAVARVRNISISRVTIEDVDPRYPILHRRPRRPSDRERHHQGRVGPVSRRADDGSMPSSSGRSISRTPTPAIRRRRRPSRSRGWSTRSSRRTRRCCRASAGIRGEAAPARGADDPYNVPGDAARVPRAEQLRHPARLRALRAPRPRA